MNDAPKPSSASGEDLLLTAHWVLPISAPPIAGGAVRVRERRIVAVGTRDALDGPAKDRIDLAGAALLPGLVNVHTHLELTLLRGLREEVEFDRWLDRLVRTKYEFLEPGDFAAGARLGVLEAIRAGVTTVGDAGDQGVVAAELARSGLRGVAYQEVFGPDPAQCGASLDALERCLSEQARHAVDRVRLGVSPHAPYTVSAELFRRVSELALERGLPVSIHVAESAAEGAFIRECAGPFAERLRARGIAPHGRSRSSVQYLEELGVLRARPLIVHAIDVDARDLDLLGERECAVAHCPKSNAKLGHGTAPLVEMLARRIAVGLGSDSAASNNTCDIIDEARVAAFLQRARRDLPEPPKASLTATELLELATAGGARALGLDRAIGTLAAGKRADLIAVDLGGAATRPVNDPASAIVFAAGRSDVKFVMVDGAILLRGRDVSTLEESAIVEEASERASSLRARLARAGERIE